MRYRTIARLAVILALLATGLGGGAQAQSTAPVTYYVPGQVIVSGLETEVTTLVKNSGFSLRPIPSAEIDLSYTDGLGAIPGFPFAARKTLIIRLYDTGASPVVTVVNSLNWLAANQQNPVNVRAEPNYVTGQDPGLVQGSPWSVGGSPWSVGGSSASDGAAAADGFLDQWAFSKDGVGLFRGSGEKRARTVAAAGAGVPVAIFDTSPFDLMGAASGSFSVSIITPTLKLDVRHPPLMIDTPSYAIPAPQPAVDESDHGLFIAGIIHAVAPQSQIRLVRVLNRYGQGDVFSLCRALHAFIEEQATAGARGVINLSLGVFPPPATIPPSLPAELSALETAMLAADGAGQIVVAASGNQAALASPLPPQQLPASYATVLGVAGSTSGRGRSCFSNPGDIGAPGGDGGPACTPKLDSCVGDCSLAIISLASDPTTISGYRYSYWLGTSFAAPFASGAAALQLGQRGGALTPAELRAQILAGATPPSLAPSDSSLGAGILSLQRALLPYEVALPIVTR